MFQINVQATIYELDAAGYTSAMKKYLEQSAKQAAREFAKTALSRIPIRTGFVAGSFGTLTDLLGSGSRFNPIVSVVRGAISKARSFLGIKKAEVSANNQVEYYTGHGGKVLKTTVSGRQFATKSEDILKWEGDILIFRYDVDITYFALNDNVGGRSPTAPWGAFAAGQVAFEDYMEKSGLLALPKFEDHLIVKTRIST